MIWVSVGEVGLEMSQRIIPCIWISLDIIQHVIYPTIVLLIRRSWQDVRGVNEGRPMLDGLETGLELWLAHTQILEDFTSPKRNVVCFWMFYTKDDAIIMKCYIKEMCASRLLRLEHSAWLEELKGPSRQAHFRQCRPLSTTSFLQRLMFNEQPLRNVLSTIDSSFLIN
jgi:hypothetical protein